VIESVKVKSWAEAVSMALVIGLLKERKNKKSSRTKEEQSHLPNKEGGPPRCDKIRYRKLAAAVARWHLPLPKTLFPPPVTCFFVFSIFIIPAPIF
jgi:hypothetical protein